MMVKIKVNLRKNVDASYEIIVERGISNKLPALLKKKFGKRKIVIITDTNAGKYHGKKLCLKFIKSGFDASVIIFKSGEEQKRLSTIEKIQEKMLKNGVNRTSVSVLLGGGVVGDVGGFASATFMRGIDFVQVPTTLLAMVDSSIGGKTGVDLQTGKNMSGSFTQPKLVLIDIDFLKTLPKKEFSNGISEVVKYGVISDARLFSYIEKNKGKIRKRDYGCLNEIIKRSCAIKANIVGKDEHEGNLRKILNYGHTVGHAIEAAGNYRKYSHGEGISIGMNAEGLISKKLKGMNLHEIERQKKLLEFFSLPTRMPKIGTGKIVRLMAKDKKSSGGKLAFALPKKIGKMMNVKGRFGIEVKRKIVESALKEAGK